MITETNKLPERHKWLNLIQEEIENGNRHKEIKLVAKPYPQKILGPAGFTGELYQTFKEELMQILKNSSRK